MIEFNMVSLSSVLPPNWQLDPDTIIFMFHPFAETEDGGICSARSIKELVVVKNCQGSEMLVCLQANKLVCQLCWQKT